jgi:hypothetical protein
MGTRHAPERAHDANEVGESLGRITPETSANERQIVVVGLGDPDRQIVPGCANQ